MTTELAAAPTRRRDVSRAMSREDALEITRKINETAATLAEARYVLAHQLREAYDGRAWVALGYPNWREYATGEFRLPQATAYRLLNLASTVSQLAEAVGIPDNEELDFAEELDLTVRDVAAVSGDIEGLAADAAARVAAGEDPSEAARAAVEERRQVKASARVDGEEVEVEVEEGDPVSELERAMEEIQNLEALVASLQNNAQAEEIVQWSRRYGALEGRLRAANTEVNELKRQVDRQRKVLSPLRSLLGAERDDQVPSLVEALIARAGRNGVAAP